MSATRSETQHDESRNSGDYGQSKEYIWDSGDERVGHDEDLSWLIEREEGHCPSQDQYPRARAIIAAGIATAIRMATRRWSLGMMISLVGSNQSPVDPESTTDSMSLLSVGRGRKSRGNSEKLRLICNSLSFFSSWRSWCLSENDSHSYSKPGGGGLFEAAISRILLELTKIF